MKTNDAGATTATDESPGCVEKSNRRRQRREMSSCSSSSNEDEIRRLAFTSDPDYHSARTLLQRKGDIKAMTHAYMSLFGDQFLAFVKAMVDAEVSHGSEDQAAEMIRGNTPCMKMLSEVAYVVGTGYLRDVLTGPMSVLFHLPESLEVNHEIVRDEATLEAHRAQLESLAQAILDRLVRSPFPPLLASLCLCLRRSVAARFHAHSDSVLGGFLFLRVVCPVVVMPYHSVVFPHLEKANLPSHARRSSILVAKLLQNLANNAFFKEDYMAPFNPFIRRNFPTVVAFYDRICQSVDVTTLATSIPPRDATPCCPSPLSIDEAWKVVRDRLDSPLDTFPLSVALPLQKPSMSNATTTLGDLSTASATLSLDRPKQKASSTTSWFNSTFFLSHRGGAPPPPLAFDQVFESQRHNPLDHHADLIQMAHTGLVALLNATNTAHEQDASATWTNGQTKRGVQVHSRVRRAVLELKASVVVAADPSTCLAYIAAPRGREIWSTWGHEVRELERLDCTSRILHRTNYGSKLPPFLLWCCMQLQDAVELESVFYPNESSDASHDKDDSEPATCATGDTPSHHALVFQSVTYPDVPPVSGVVRSCVHSSGFVLSPIANGSNNDDDAKLHDATDTLVTFAIRMDHALAPLQAKPYQKQLLTLAKLKVAIEKSATTASRASGS
ncbi:hypothetical protein, variant 1 [Aphanomyces invadans]|uniref:Ras-GAP domain-containing protein n=2 Tax=Aphanomyces invadans TaxID=157072 RepID=A0A024UUG9_9STRA|nr:hypothetical protein, variant 1 [Aphanomyces invadans]ETW09303.1 hypothetical protein, variant 1 [Aphanomyces invadans]|eukprot:XP_008863112.1 hypothetical protein, variant 1 [Aphanomyces invadans]